MICSAELGLNVSDRANPYVSANKPYFDVPYSNPDPHFQNTDWFESDIVISALFSVSQGNTLYPAYDTLGCIADMSVLLLSSRKCWKSIGVRACVPGAKCNGV